MGSRNMRSAPRINSEKTLSTLYHCVDSDRWPVLACGSISAFLFEHFRKTDYREGRIGIAVFMGLFGVFLTAGSIRMWIQNKRTKED